VVGDHSIHELDVRRGVVVLGIDGRIWRECHWLAGGGCLYRFLRCKAGARAGDPYAGDKQRSQIGPELAFHDNKN
jgi:hypothetical protein